VPLDPFPTRAQVTPKNFHILKPTRSISKELDLNGLALSIEKTDFSKLIFLIQFYRALSTRVTDNECFLLMGLKKG